MTQMSQDNNDMLGSDTIIYIGCHTNERHDDGTPRHKAESVFKTSLPYARAVKLLRGLNDIVKKLLAFSCDDQKEPLSWKDLFKS